jgi:hypothetical protein
MLCHNQDLYASCYPWTVYVGWLQGGLYRQQMMEWCMDQWGTNQDTWHYDMGGTYWFARLDDAVAFELTWADQPLR